MSLKFLNLKAFHPGNKKNQREKFIAEEKHNEFLNEEKKALKEFEEEQLNWKEKIQEEEEHAHTLKNLENLRKKEERNKAEKETQAVDPDYKISKKKRRKKKEKIVSRPLSFLYVLPPGLKAMMEKEEKEKSMLLNEKTITPTEPSLLEPKKEDKDTSKLVQNDGGYKQGSNISYKPFGIEVKEIKCTKCGAIGHSSIEKICPLYYYFPLDEKRKEFEDPLNEINRIKNDNSKIEIKSLNSFNPEDLIPEEDELIKQKKALKKEYKKLKKKLKLEK